MAEKYEEIDSVAALAGVTMAGCMADPLTPEHKAQLEALIENPTSDMSQLSHEDIEIAAQLYALYYLKLIRAAQVTCIH
jgi:hypothetical protein